MFSLFNVLNVQPTSPPKVIYRSVIIKQKANLLQLTNLRQQRNKLQQQYNTLYQQNSTLQQQNSNLT
ncbi:hypothetical protein F8M41_022349 [Gigaspora margarita]|uniref:Uncharacterized protein n=1 Tax=Gigaspora margarita TaxID=4874 RepID=A0A8H4EI84_GIGMA|nr:hypothetical protein F8M41_022349 [Gigaspora margarita]